MCQALPSTLGRAHTSWDGVSLPSYYRPGMRFPSSRKQESSISLVVKSAPLLLFLAPSSGCFSPT